MKKIWIVVFLVLLFLWFVPWVPILKLGIVAYRPYEPDGKSRFWRVAGPRAQEGEWAAEPEINRECIAAAVVSEDPRFFDHRGVDIVSIRRAIALNKKGSGKQIWGGSTITQQLVKNLFLSRAKSYLRKAREVVGAVLLDAILSKEEQLIWYLNVVEFGPRIYGIKSAAKHFFNKSPKELTLSECAALISELPNPRVFSRFVNKQKPRGYERRCSYIMARVAKDRRVSCDSYGEISALR